MNTEPSRSAAGATAPRHAAAGAGGASVGPFEVPALTGPAIGLAQWRANTSFAFVPLDIHPLRSGEFSGRLERRDLGAMSVFLMEHSAAVVARTPQLIARGAGDLLKVSLQLGGDGTVEQDGRVALLHPGDFAVYDTSRPYTLRFDTDTKMAVLAFPAASLALPREEIAHVTATAFPLESPLGTVVNPFLAGLATSLMSLGDEDGQRLARTALDLLLTVITGELREGVRQDPRRQQLHEILEGIEQMLPDPDLTPGMIAQQHFISTRHLHSLFSERGITVGAWVRSRRLEHIRRDLADPSMAAIPVAQVAARWGLTNAPHFSRLFRATFGATPSAYRRSSTPSESQVTPGP